MKVLTIVVLCLGAAALIFAVVTFIISAVAARKDGIIRAVFPLDIKLTVLHLVLVAPGICLVVGYTNEARTLREHADDREEHGIAAYAEHYDVVEVDSLTDVAYANYEFEITNARKRAQEKQENAWIHVAFTLCWAFAAALNGAFITEKGVRRFAALKNKTALMKAEDGKLLLYEENRAAPILKLSDSEENRGRFAGFGISETAGEQEF